MKFNYHLVYRDKYGRPEVIYLRAHTLARALVEERRLRRYSQRNHVDHKRVYPTFLGVLQCCGTVNVFWHPVKGATL